MEPSARQTLDDVLATCALYRQARNEWPVEVRLDAKRLGVLARGCDGDGLSRLAAHVRLSTRETDGVSAGGHGTVIQLDRKPSGDALGLARMWMGEIDLTAPPHFQLNRGFWDSLIKTAGARSTRTGQYELADLLLAAHSPTPGPIEVTDDEQANREELLFWATYVASFGIDGIHPKQLAVGRRTYHDSASSPWSAVLMLHMPNDRIVTGEPPWHVLDLFPASQEDLAARTFEFAVAMVEAAQDLAG